MSCWQRKKKYSRTPSAQTIMVHIRVLIVYIEHFATCFRWRSIFVLLSVQIFYEDWFYIQRKETILANSLLSALSLSMVENALFSAIFSRFSIEIVPFLIILYVKIRQVLPLKWLAGTSALISTSWPVSIFHRIRSWIQETTWPIFNDE